MPDCGVLEFLRGGLIAEGHITASAITDSRISSSELQSCQINKLASIDTESAQVIADALANLPECALAALAQAIVNAKSQLVLADAPANTTEPALPTTVAGNRELLLGKPDVWIAFQGYTLPGYKEVQNG